MLLETSSRKVTLKCYLLPLVYLISTLRDKSVATLVASVLSQAIIILCDNGFSSLGLSICLPILSETSYIWNHCCTREQPIRQLEWSHVASPLCLSPAENICRLQVEDCQGKQVHQLHPVLQPSREVQGLPLACQEASFQALSRSLASNHGSWSIKWNFISSTWQFFFYQNCFQSINSRSLLVLRVLILYEMTVVISSVGSSLEWIKGWQDKQVGAGWKECLWRRCGWNWKRR